MTDTGLYRASNQPRARCANLSGDPSHCVGVNSLVRKGTGRARNPHGRVTCSWRAEPAQLGTAAQAANLRKIASNVPSAHDRVSGKVT
jgi:hypothetical protein